MEQQPQCAICGTTQRLLRCAKCKTIYYCSSAHQHKDWPAHKQECRLLAKQKSNHRIQQLQQAVAATTLNNSAAIGRPPPTDAVTAGSVPMSCGVDAGHHHWTALNGDVGVGGGGSGYDGTEVGFGLLGGDGDAAVEPSILTAVPPMAVMLGTNENEIMNSQAEVVARHSTGIYPGNIEASSTTMEQMQFRGSASNNSVGNFAGNVGGLQQQFQVPEQRFQTPNVAQNFDFNQQQLPPYPHYQPHITNHNTQQHEKSISCEVGSSAASGENSFGNVNERRYDELCRNIINDMNQYGLSVVDDFLGVEKGLQILNEVHRMYAAGVFKDGQLVNNLREEELHTIRGDKITWVKGVEPGCANVGYLINQVDAVICRANTMKNNGQLGKYNIKERTKAMVACYPGSGSQYVVHVDNPNKDGRVITAIYYLNVNWDTKRSGGVLRIFPEHGNSVADIEPKFDRLIFFWSDKRNPHEVQPAHRTRYAITVWYFDANEREAALNRCKNNKNNAKVTNSKTNSPAVANTNERGSTHTTTATSATAPTTNANANPNANSIANASNKLTHTISNSNVNSPTNANVSASGATIANSNSNSSEICT